MTYRYADVEADGTVSQGSRGTAFGSAHMISVCGTVVYSTQDEKDFSVMLARIITETRRILD